MIEEDADRRAQESAGYLRRDEGRYDGSRPTMTYDD
jgi:hypothetical protein